MIPNRPTTSLVGLASVAFFSAFWFGTGATSLAGQTQYLESTKPTGQPIAPFFEGWYANPTRDVVGRLGVTLGPAT